MKREISTLIGAIKNIPTDERLSDSALAALSAINATLYQLVVSEDLETEYGNRRQYRDKIEELYRIGRQRYEKKDCTGKSRILPVLYDIAYRLPLSDSRKLEQCEAAAFRLIKSYLEENGTQEWQTEHGILKCIENAYRHTMEGDRESEEYTYFKRRIAAWISEWNGAGSWTGVSDREAMSRLEILVQNSETLLDATYDAEIAEIHEYYYRKAEKSGSAEDIYALALLYETTVEITGLKERRNKRKHLAEMAENKLSEYAVGSDEWWHSHSVLIKERSLQLSEEIQDTIIAHTA